MRGDDQPITEPLTPEARGRVPACAVVHSAPAMLFESFPECLKCLALNCQAANRRSSGILFCSVSASQWPMPLSCATTQHHRLRHTTPHRRPISCGHTHLHGTNPTTIIMPSQNRSLQHTSQPHHCLNIASKLEHSLSRMCSSLHFIAHLSRSRRLMTTHSPFQQSTPTLCHHTFPSLPYFNSLSLLTSTPPPTLSPTFPQPSHESPSNSPHTAPSQSRPTTASTVS